MGRHSEMELHSGINSLEYTSMINENDEMTVAYTHSQNKILTSELTG